MQPNVVLDAAGGANHVADKAAWLGDFRSLGVTRSVEGVRARAARDVRTDHRSLAAAGINRLRVAQLPYAGEGVGIDDLELQSVDRD